MDLCNKHVDLANSNEDSTNKKRLNSSNQYGLRNDWLLLNKLYCFLGYKQTMHDSRDFGSCQISGPQVVQLPAINSLTLLDLGDGLLT